MALLTPDAADCEPCLEPDRLQSELDANPDSLIVYNQHAEARALVDRLSLPANQVLIEIRQDTRGVLGLHALHRHEHGDETLELNYQ